MTKISTILDREIVYAKYDTRKSWISEFPNKNWCLLIIAEQANKRYFSEIISKAIDRNVGYICGIGKQHNLIHNIADDEIQFRDADIEKHYLPNHTIMTVGEEDFEEGLWEGIFITHNLETDIDTIVILDVTKTAFPKVNELIKKYNKGYLPDGKPAGNSK